MSTVSPPRLKKRFAHHQTRWEKEKAVQGNKVDNPDDPKTIGSWLLGDTVGKGASGRVKLAKNIKTGKLAAVKILNLHPAFSSRSLSTMGDQTEKLMLAAEREIAMMKIMDHPNIMKMYDVWGSPKEIFLVLEYVEGGELFDYLCAHKGRLPLLEVVSIFKQVIAGVDYCHKFNICHRDLKPENILLDSITKAHKIVKIADFGMSRLDHLNGLLETSCGSPHYASPEIIQGRNYEGASADIWSCGVILFALLTSRLPFDDPNVRTVLSKVKVGKYTIPDDVPPVARDLVARILTPVDRRINMEGILKHPLLQMATPGIIVNPSPSMDELALPVTEAEIDPDLLRNLSVILREPVTAMPDLIKKLTSAEKNWEKAFYFLLTRYRDKLFEEFNMEQETNPRDGPMSPITRHYPGWSWTPRTGKDSPPVPTAPIRSHIRANSQPYEPYCGTKPSMEAGNRPRHTSVLAKPGARPPSVSVSYRPSGSASRPSSASGSRPPPATGIRVARDPGRPSARPVSATGARPSSVGSVRPSIHIPLSRISTTQPPPTNIPSVAPRTALPKPTPLSKDGVRGLGVVSSKASDSPNASFPTNPPNLMSPLPPPPMLPPAPPQLFSDPLIQKQAEALVEQINQWTIKQQEEEVKFYTASQLNLRQAGGVEMGKANTQPAEKTAPIDTDANSAGMTRRHTDEGRTRHTKDIQERVDSESVLMPGAYAFPKPIFVSSSPAKEAFMAVAANAEGGISKRDRTRPAALDLSRGSPYRADKPSGLHSPLITPFLGVAASTGRGFFAKLFDWRTPSYHLFSVENCAKTRDECMTLLRSLGAMVVVEDAETWGILKCRVDEIQDSDGVLASKPVRFRVEFAPYTSSPLDTPTIGHKPYSNSPLLSPQLEKSFFPVAAGPTPPPPPGISVLSTLSLVQEKGALSTFKAVYNRLRDGWTYDKFHSPALPIRGSPTFGFEHSAPIAIRAPSNRNGY